MHPTPRLTSARMMLHLAAAHDLTVHIMDVDQAFLHGELEEEIYMEPPGMPGHPGPDMVWRLRRPLLRAEASPPAMACQDQGGAAQPGVQSLPMGTQACS